MGSILWIAVVWFASCVHFGVCTASSKGLSGDKIVGGVNADPHEFPYQISLQWNLGPNVTRRPIHFCGGSILNRNWVITAAHCRVRFTKHGWIEVVAGEHDTTRDEEGEQRRRARKFIIHRAFCGGVCPYDIGLIQVDESFQLGKNISAIALPKPFEKFTGDCVASGWGSTSTTDRPMYPEKLRKAILPIVDFPTCYRYWINDGNPDAVSNICAGPQDGSRSVCSGDSGGPLMKYDGKRGKPILVGVASWGTIPCGIEEKPAVFTAVANFIDWIKANML
ncbi:trypsin-1-like [Toxorhynchites rutilus septentrionalis]|uniref:trypsin-1-like n=1 Tax=Toxorhynchites rutilus septentrionalis TaxID=329112 RepID=UPI00247B0EE5|nr:trypsin-1-like [Toxorhynchites rutilus septentrionalis]